LTASIKNNTTEINMKFQNFEMSLQEKM